MLPCRLYKVDLSAKSLLALRARLAVQNYYGLKAKMMSLPDGKIAKLRASCDGCNESKVRCSQTKPRCERCARLGLACVYGLSRRSHKTAPRVGSTQADLSSFLGDDAQMLVSRRSLDTSGDAPSPSSNGHSAGAAGLISDMASTLQSDDAMTADGSLLDHTALMSSYDSHAQQLTNSSLLDLSMSLDPAFSPTNDPLTGIHGLLGEWPQTKSNIKDGSNSDGFFDSGISGGESHSSASASCDCNSLVVKQLLSPPFRSEEESGPLDTQLAQLKEAISVSEHCIGCTCASRDDMSIRTIYIFFPFVVPIFSCNGTGLAVA